MLIHEKKSTLGGTPWTDHFAGFYLFDGPHSEKADDQEHEWDESRQKISSQGHFTFWLRQKKILYCFATQFSCSVPLFPPPESPKENPANTTCSVCPKPILSHLVQRFVGGHEAKVSQGPGAAAGSIPTDLDQSTGLERAELLGKMQGKDIFDLAPLEVHVRGTKASPTIINSRDPIRYVGCTGMKKETPSLFSWTFFFYEGPAVFSILRVQRYSSFQWPSPWRFVSCA